MVAHNIPVFADSSHDLSLAQVISCFTTIISLVELQCVLWDGEWEDDLFNGVDVAVEEVL